VLACPGMCWALCLRRPTLAEPGQAGAYLKPFNVLALAAEECYLADTSKPPGQALCEELMKIERIQNWESSEDKNIEKPKINQLPQIVQIKYQEIKVSYSNERDDKALVNMTGLVRSFKRGLKQLTDQVNEVRTDYAVPVTQHETANFCTKYGIQFIKSINELEDLKKANRTIQSIGKREDIELWEKTAEINIIKGRDRWGGSINKETKYFYSALSDDLHLSQSYLLQIGMMAVMMQAPTECIRQDYREGYRDMILSFIKWINKRMIFSKKILNVMGNDKSQDVKLEYLLTWNKDILQAIECD